MLCAIVMTSLTFDVHGDRISVKASAMQHLYSLAEQVLQQAGLADTVTMANVRCFHNKRELEMSTPFRFLNIPSAARIELVTGP